MVEQRGQMVTSLTSRSARPSRTSTPKNSVKQPDSRATQATIGSSALATSTV
jgi:hypothetical protein